MALAEHLPLALSVRISRAEIEGQPKPKDGEGPEIDRTGIEPGYFATLGIPILAGRDFDGHDAGARRGDVLRLVVREGMVLTGIGLAIGLGLALAAARLLGGWLYGIGSADPVTYLGVALVLGPIALFANLVPAQRATEVDPIVALRYE